MMKHKSISLADQVFERLETDIISGKYKRGQILTELALTEDLGVSRTPVREAIQLLEQEQLIVLQPKGILVLGVTVTEGGIGDPDILRHTERHTAVVEGDTRHTRVGIDISVQIRLRHVLQFVFVYFLLKQIGLS